MEKSLYAISFELKSLIDKIIESDGEITDDIENQLKISKEELYQKLGNYRRAVCMIENRAAACKAEKQRLDVLQKTRERAAKRLKDSMLEALLLYGETGKSGNKVIELEDCKLFTKSTESVIENKERLDILRYEFIEYCRELYKNDLLITGDDIDIQGLIDAINAKCIAERGEAFAPFTIYDFICTNITFKFTVSLKNLIESNNYLLQAYYGLDYSTGVDIDIDKNTVKYIVKDQTTNDNITIANLENTNSLCIK